MPVIDRDLPPAAALADVLAGQAAALDRVFMRGFAAMLSGKTRSRRDVSRALKAQNQCRIALKLLLKLRAAEQTGKKSRNRTNELLREKNHHRVQALGKALPRGRLWHAHASPQVLVTATTEAGLVRRSALARRRIGWVETLGRSRTFARSPPGYRSRGPCMKPDQPIRPAHGHGR